MILELHSKLAGISLNLLRSKSKFSTMVLLLKKLPINDDNICESVKTLPLC